MNEKERKMNERIRELAEQAGLETQPAKLKIYKNDDGTVTSGGWEYPLEKFAELIVQECAQVIVNGGYFTDIFGNRKNASPEETAQMIKWYFGVEE